jgi:hypothetical protein
MESIEKFLKKLDEAIQYKNKLIEKYDNSIHINICANVEDIILIKSWYMYDIKNDLTKEYKINFYDIILGGLDYHLKKIDSIYSKPLSHHIKKSIETVPKDGSKIRLFPKKEKLKLIFTSPVYPSFGMPREASGQFIDGKWHLHAMNFEKKIIDDNDWLEFVFDGWRHFK